VAVVAVAEHERRHLSLVAAGLQAEEQQQMAVFQLVELDQN
jgi:hypothetical protein